MSSPYTPLPSPFTIRLDPGDGDQPIEQFGMAIYVLLQLAIKTPSWFCISDARGGFVQIARRREGYIVEWSWEGMGVRRRNRLAYVATRSTKGPIVSQSKRKLFTLYQHSFVHLGDAFEILHDFWVGKPRPNRFPWFDRSKDHAKLKRIKKSTPTPRHQSKPKVTSAPRAQKQIHSTKSSKNNNRGVFMLFDGDVTAKKIMETININDKKPIPTYVAADDPTEDTDKTKVKKENTARTPRLRSKPKVNLAYRAEKQISGTKALQNKGSKALMSDVGLSTEQMDRIFIDVSLGRPLRDSGPGVKEYASVARKEIQDMIAKGQIIDLPFD